MAIKPVVQEGLSASRHPFQFFAFVALAISGFGTAFDVGQPATLQALIPEFWVDIWGWMVMVGGLLGALTVFWPDRVTSLLLERIALMAIAGVSFVYTLALVKVGGPSALVAATQFTGITVAGIVRARQVTRELGNMGTAFECVSDSDVAGGDA